MSAAQPTLGFFGETIETCIGVAGGATFGFLTGGPWGAVLGVLGCKTYVSWRWETARSDAANETMGKVGKILLNLGFAAFGVIGFVAFGISRSFTCGKDLYSSVCYRDFWLERISAVIGLSFLSLAVYAAVY